MLGQWKGEAPLTLTVKQPGGVRDGIQIKVAGVRSFADNEETVLFLRPSMAADGTMVVVGLMQGNFRVLRNASGAATVANGVRDVLSYSPAERAVGTYRGGSMPLAELERRVRKAVGR